MTQIIINYEDRYLPLLSFLLALKIINKNLFIVVSMQKCAIKIIRYLRDCIWLLIYHLVNYKLSIAKFIFSKSIQHEGVVLRSYSIDDFVRKDCRVTLWIRNFEVQKRLPLTAALLKVPARSVAMGCNVNSRDLCNFFSKIRFI